MQVHLPPTVEVVGLTTKDWGLEIDPLTVDRQGLKAEEMKPFQNLWIKNGTVKSQVDHRADSQVDARCRQKRTAVCLARALSLSLRGPSRPPHGLQ